MTTSIAMKVEMAKIPREAMLGRQDPMNRILCQDHEGGSTHIGRAGCIGVEKRWISQSF
jgi:hypothetical protein